MILAANKLNYSWQSDKTDKAVVDYSAEFRSGIPHYICGPSGSGKTTLGYLLSQLYNPDSGKVSLDGVPSCRRVTFGYVFQFAENIFFEDTLADEAKHIPAVNLNLMHNVFASLGMDYRKIEQQNPFRLSAGYARLAAIGLQMARDPQVLILDEPTIGLDWRFRERVRIALEKWIMPEQILIIITHDLDFMRELPGDAWAMSCGRLVWHGSTENMLREKELLKQLALD